MCIKNNLSVDGLIVEKDRLEASITTAVAALIQHFKDRTGLDVRDVEVPMVDVSSMRDTYTSYAVGRAKVNTNLV